MPPPKRQTPSPHSHYELLYHPSIPGRGEFIRLALEATSTPYTDVANASADGYAEVQASCGPDAAVAPGAYPVFSPPALRVTVDGDGDGVGGGGGRGRGARKLVIHQTPTILSFLGPRLGLVGGAGDRDGEGDRDRDRDGEEEEGFFVQQVALTALDCNNEAHDTHHPIAVALTYEDQKDAALQKAAAFRRDRIPKFLAYFSKVLATNGGGKYLVGKRLTYADTTVWQVLDGLKYAFPNEMKARLGGEHAELDKWYAGLRREKWLSEYLSSDRRKEYSMGIFRHYPELDRES